MMYRKVLFIGLLLITFAAKAHNADASTTILVEKENGTWVLQISASLTAFQHEIRTHFAETPYKTPEEFQQMVLQHLKNNLQISFNDADISFGKGTVKLGHETNVVFEVFGIPSDIKSARIKNSAFKDIHRNKSSFIVLKNGFNKKHFVLNNENNHTLALEVSGNELVEISESKTSLFTSNTALFITFEIVLVLTMFSFFELFKPEKMVISRVE